MINRIMRQSRHRSRSAAVWRALRNIWAAWEQRRHEVDAAAELMSFSDRALADFGIGRCEIATRVRYPPNQLQPSDD
ncbi:MAG TPA: DUF1127 domain-containing protein [Afipia sp.]